MYVTGGLSGALIAILELTDSQWKAPSGNLIVLTAILIKFTILDTDINVHNQLDYEII